MKRVSRLKASWLTVSVAIFALGSAAGVNGQSPSPITDRPAYRVGDAWTFTIANNDEPKRSFSRTVILVTEDGTATAKNETESVSVYDPAVPVGATYFRYSESAPDHRGAFIREDKVNPPPFTFPLQVGKKWSFKPPAYKFAGDTVEDEYDAEVRSYEKVHVPAGDFDAYKIQFDGWWNNRSWALAQGAAGRKTMEVWYAPAAKRVIYYQIRTYQSIPYIWTMEVTTIKMAE